MAALVYSPWGVASPSQDPAIKDSGGGSEYSPCEGKAQKSRISFPSAFASPPTISVPPAMHLFSFCPAEEPVDQLLRGGGDGFERVKDLHEVGVRVLRGGMCRPVALAHAAGPKTSNPWTISPIISDSCTYYS